MPAPGDGRTVGIAPRDGSTRQGRSPGFAFERAPADVVAVELPGPGNPGHLGIGPALRCGHGLAQRAHAQHATTGGDDAIAIKPGAGDGGAPHVNVTVLMRGLLLHAFTRLYFADEEPANATDPVLAEVPAERRHTLIAKQTAPGRYRFDIRMQGDDETVFFDV